ncbi:MAG: hypothetical protein RIB98_09260 [Acidimicrobiales bacterium]
MSVPVPLDEIEAAAAAYGGSAFVLVSSIDGPPRVTHSFVRFESSRLRVSIGRRSAAALATNSSVSVLWPADASQSMSLIVDGVVVDPIDDEGGTVAIEPTGAVRHRPASQ